jgi:hypothetical protein
MNKMKLSGNPKKPETIKGEKTMKTKKFMTIITLLILCMVFSVNINAFMIANESEGAYLTPPPAPDGTASIRSITLRQLIADGGSHFLKSAGYINQFLNLVESSELTGPDYIGLQKNLNAAIFYLKKARVTYLQLKNQASETPYKQEVIYRLLNFAYDSFQKENGLFPVIFKKVKSFLATGNVTGIYNEFYSYTGHILDLLYTIKKDIDYEIFPDLSSMWNINQKYSEVKLFGQYVAMVFYSINKGV